jgi:hypothetical protein
MISTVHNRGKHSSIFILGFLGGFDPFSHLAELFECLVREEHEVLQKAGLSGEADPENYLGGSSIEGFKLDSWAEHEIYFNGAAAWSEFQWDFHARCARMARRSPRMVSKPRFTERKRESGASSMCPAQRIASQPPEGPAKELGT